MKIAFIGTPRLGGVYTVMRALRDALAPHGFEVRWVAAGVEARDALRAPAVAPEAGRGDLVAPEASDEAACGVALARHVAGAGFGGVLINVRTEHAGMNVARYLPATLPRVMIVHNTTPGTYAPARGLRDWVHATVGVSPRVRDDLVQRYGFAGDRTSVIRNAINPGLFWAPAPRSDPGGPLRVLSLGRIEDSSKGVFWLPSIMRRLGPAAARLVIAGDGPDLPALRRRCAGLGDRVEFLGAVAPPTVPDLLRRHQVLLFPSRYEGLPLTLIEAMAAGCVPVASRLRGVTDDAIEHGRSGLLFKVGDVAAAARHLRDLATQPLTLARMSAAGQQAVGQRFTLDAFAAAYAELLGRLVRHCPEVRPPLPLEKWACPRQFGAGLRGWVPHRLKNYLRTWRG